MRIIRVLILLLMLMVSNSVYASTELDIGVSSISGASNSSGYNVKIPDTREVNSIVNTVDVSFSKLVTNSVNIDNRQYINDRFQVNLGDHFRFGDVSYTNNPLSKIYNRYGIDFGLGVYHFKDNDKYLSYSVMLVHYDSSNLQYNVIKVEERFKYTFYLQPTILFKQVCTYETTVLSDIQKREIHNKLILSSKIVRDIMLNLSNDTMYISGTSSTPDNKLLLSVSYEF